MDFAEFIAIWLEMNNMRQHKQYSRGYEKNGKDISVTAYDRADILFRRPV